MTFLPKPSCVYALYSNIPAEDLGQKLITIVLDSIIKLEFNCEQQQAQHDLNTYNWSLPQLALVLPLYYCITIEALLSPFKLYSQLVMAYKSRLKIKPTHTGTNKTTIFTNTMRELDQRKGNTRTRTKRKKGDAVTSSSDVRGRTICQWQPPCSS